MTIIVTFDDKYLLANTKSGELFIFDLNDKQ